MAFTTENDSKISIKVMIDKEKNRVVYAQADHTFVDILFSFMTLPLGAIVRQLGKQTDKEFEVLPSLNNLYRSLADLPESYFLTKEFKFMLLNPRNPSHDELCRNLKVKIEDTEPKTYSLCENQSCGQLVFYRSNKARCTRCGEQMNRKFLSYIYNDDCVGGGMFVSDISTFIVTDGLLVMPYTSRCCIELLIELGVSDMTHIEERTVDIGYEQIQVLLRLSMSNISPLTYLVLSKKNMQVKHDDQCCASFGQADSMSTMSLDVYLQKSSGKLLFAEAEDDFVDFVFGFLSISLGTLIGTLMDGSSSLVFMDNCFKSIKGTDLGKYFKSIDMKNKLIKPHFGQHIAPSQIWQLDSWFLKYRLNKDEMFNRSGFFKRSGMFMVTDDLVITPSVSASTMDILNKYQVPFNDIETHKVSINFEEGLRILEASLRSQSALTKGLEHQLKKLNPNS